eukprot:Gb_26824 [translate_table: standard]
MAQRRSDLQGLFPQRKINNAFFPSKPDKVEPDRASKKQLDIVPSTYEDASLSTATVGADSVQSPSLSSDGFPYDHAYEDIDEVEMILRQFDMNLAYGPCLGVSRLERWERASRLGLNPSHQIKDILERVGGMPHCLWEGHV